MFNILTCFGDAFLVLKKWRETEVEDGLGDCEYSLYVPEREGWKKGREA